MTNPTPTATCPKCGSASIQAVPVKKSSLGKAFVAEYFLGTAAGVAAGGGDTVIQVVCLSCGCQYFPGTKQEQQVRALSGQLGDKAKKEAEEEIAAAAALAEATESRQGKIFFVCLLILILVIILKANGVF